MTPPDPLSKRALLSRYLSGESLTLQQLTTIIENFWPEISSDYILEKALDEPPKSPIASPSVMVLLLQSIRQMLTARSELTADEREIFNAAREKRALALASIDSLARETRLLRAYDAVLDNTPLDDVRRVDTVKMIGEIGYRLVVEFGHSEMVATCATAFRWLYQHDRDRPNLRALSRHYEMCVRQLKLSSAAAEGEPALDLAAKWQKLQNEARAELSQDDSASSQSSKERWCGAARRALLSAVINDPQAMHLTAAAAVTCFEEVNRLRYEEWDTDLNADLSETTDPRDVLQDLVVGVLTLLRLKTEAGLSERSDGRSMLITLLRALRFYDYTQDERAREFAQQGGMANIASILANPPSLAQRATPDPIVIDEVALQNHVDELLQTPRRVGLALSGGGLRAAFFHVGVMARLAETDHLRRLDLVSCVSGGSIAGAGFAIRLKALLQQKFDLDIKAEDYVQVVQDVMDRLLAIGRANLRMRAFANPCAVLRMWLQPNYTFTARIAELLDSHFFAPLHPDAAKLSHKKLRRITAEKREMTRPGSIGRLRASLAEKPKLGWPIGPWDLLYVPRGEKDDTRTAPGGNPLRRATVPEFVFNTTALNTGSAFRFSAEGLGEQLNANVAEISQRPRLAWLEYDDLSIGGGLEPHRLPLSRVVAASASVPGIIPPVIVGRHAKDQLVALADGGVVDNQGADHLLEQRCTHIIISDASGQLRFESSPDVTNMSVMARSSDILMERIRELNYARARRDTEVGTIEQLTYLHLTKELSEPPPPSDFRPQDVLADIYYHRDEERLSSYGIKKRVQGSLAKLRTDLDCFSDVEAYSLMLSGYLQASQVIASSSPPPAPQHQWAFLAMADSLGSGNSAKDHASALLDIGQHRFLRLPRIIFAMRHRVSAAVRFSVAAAVVVLFAYTLWVVAAHAVALIHRLLANSTIHGCLWATIAFILFALKFPPSPLKRWFVKIAAAPLLIGGMMFAWVILLIGDPLYSRLGRVR